MCANGMGLGCRVSKPTLISHCRNAAVRDIQVELVADPARFEAFAILLGADIAGGWQVCDHVRQRQNG